MQHNGTFLALVFALVAIYGLFELVLPSETSAPAPAEQAQAQPPSGEVPTSPRPPRPSLQPMLRRVDPRLQAAPPVDPWQETRPNSLPVGVSVEVAAARISEARPGLVILFSTTCSRSKRAFPQFVSLSRSLGTSVQTLAFATDDSEADVQAFTSRHGAPFSAELLATWPPGALGQALDGIGVHIGMTWMQPLVIVVGEDGEILGQWEGITNLRPVERLVRQARL